MIINGKSFYDQPVDSDIKRYEEIRKLTTGQLEDYTTGCLLDYNYNWIIKDLDADDNATIVGNDQSM